MARETGAAGEPGDDPVLRAAWVVPAGTLVSVCRAGGRGWTAHRTREEVRGREVRTAEVFGGSGAIVLEYRGWLILTRRDRCNGQTRVS